MTSGNIQMGPDPDQILEALKTLLCEDSGARQRPAGELSEEPGWGGYLRREPDPVLVAEMLDRLENEENSLQTDELYREGDLT